MIRGGVERFQAFRLSTILGGHSCVGIDRFRHHFIANSLPSRGCKWGVLPTYCQYYSVKELNAGLSLFLHISQ